MAEMSAGTAGGGSWCSKASGGGLRGVFSAEVGPSYGNGVWEGKCTHHPLNFPGDC